MINRCANTVVTTLTPFLYPSLLSVAPRAISCVVRKQFISNSSLRRSSLSPGDISENPISHLNPTPDDYSRNVFADRATITVFAGNGGHGCISFLREKFISNGPPNGGDGGYGGSIYIQPVRGETSLHKLSRRSIIRAGRGKNGGGKTQGGERGEDVVIQVPVGTVVREIERVDPVALEKERLRLEAIEDDEKKRLEAKERVEEEKKRRLETTEQDEEAETEIETDDAVALRQARLRREKWVLYPAMTSRDLARSELPPLPRERKSYLSAAQAKAPIQLDLSKPTDRPILLAAGAIGGLGNPHFVTKTGPRPKFATRGEEGLRITLELELKLLADVGLVGLPNAGKSTLLRAISNSRARVGNWAFTTLQPNIGTVVLDDHYGRPKTMSAYENGDLRTNFTIADIPGLVEDAHLDRGLGVSFLRHVERARVLAFVIDLSAGDAVASLKALWKEVGEYERMKSEEESETQNLNVEWSPFQSTEDAIANRSETIIVGSRDPKSALTPSIAGKPWFVVATKADLPNTRDNFVGLKDYLAKVVSGEEVHPSGQKHGWIEKLEAIPISAINGHGMERITSCTLSLLDD